MKCLRFFVGLTLLASVLFLNSCEPAPTHMLYIGESGCVASSVDGDRIDVVWFFPGDLVIWINTASRDMTVSFENDAIFGVSEFTVPSGKRVKLTVEAIDPITVDYSISPCDEAPGTPKAKVGDEP